MQVQVIQRRRQFGRVLRRQRLQVKALGLPARSQVDHALTISSGGQFWLRRFSAWPPERKYAAGVMPVSLRNAATNALADS